MTLRLTLFNEIDDAPRKLWLVRGWLGSGDMSVLFGAPGSGKSVLASDIAATIAAGRDWFGNRVTPAAVLYVAAERAALVKRRLAAWRLQHGVVDAPLGIADGTLDLRSNRQSVDDVIQLSGELAATYRTPVGLVVVDTVSRALAGGDENSPKDMGALVNNVAGIQSALGAHVMLVHHIPADGTQRLRGHGALLGAADTTIGVEKHATGRTATIDKNADGEEGARLSFTLESVEIARDDDGEVTTAPVVGQMDDAAPFAGQTTARRRLPDRVKNAVTVLADMCLDGKPLANGSDLPAGIRAVALDDWREELYRRGVLDADHKNPREDFRRVKAALQARSLAAERNGQIWAV